MSITILTSSSYVLNLLDDFAFVLPDFEPSRISVVFLPRPKATVSMGQQPSMLPMEYAGVALERNSKAFERVLVIWLSPPLQLDIVHSMSLSRHRYVVLCSPFRFDYRCRR